MWFIFLFALGACVGSFLNVVIYRLPRGQSIVFPGSHCPSCGRAIQWYDNVPLLSWLMLGGRCRGCKEPISPRYPIVEAATAIRVAGLYLCYYVLRVRAGAESFEHSWPMFAAHAALLCGLLACAVADIEHWIVLLEVCWVVTVVGLVSAAAAPHPFVTRVGAPAQAAALGAGVGLVLALVLLRKGILQRSFIDAQDKPVSAEAAKPKAKPVKPETQGEPAPPGKALWAILWPLRAIVALAAAVALGYVPWGRSNVQSAAITKQQGVSPRKEVLRELVFLLPSIVLAVAAYLLVTRLDAAAKAWQCVTSPACGGALAEHVNCGLSALMGYFVGGALVWGMRILGTLGFGKEAMGMGDVHLMAAVGAVTGWVVPTVAFFVAPVFALVWAAYLAIRRGQRELPYGPWLSLATIVVMLGYDTVWSYLNEYVNTLGALSRH